MAHVGYFIAKLVATPSGFLVCQTSRKQEHFSIIRVKNYIHVAIFVHSVYQSYKST